MIRKLYPYGKKKAFNVTYDDGVLQDVRFVELLNQYGLKGTFNLNSALMENEFAWTHEQGLVVKRLRTDEELAVFQIVGHSYDLDAEDMWDRMEDVFRVISEQDDVLPMTMIEMVEYLQAMEQAEITEEYIQNHSDRSLWFAVDGVVCEVKAKESL